MEEIEIGKFDPDVLRAIMEEILADPTYKENVTELNNDELDIFNMDVYDLLRLDMKQRTVDMVYAKYNKAFLFGAMRAKQMLAVSFTGSDGTAGFGVSRIKPEQVAIPGANTARAAEDGWRTTPTSNDWQDHVGDYSATQMHVTADDFGTMVIVGLSTFLANPNVRQYQFKYQASEKVKQYIEHAFRNSEMQIYNLSNPLLYTRDEEISAQMLVVTANQPVEIAWEGITFAKVSWLRADAPSF